MLRVLLATLSTVILLPSTASADVHERHGFVAGLAMGGGTVDTEFAYTDDSCGEAQRCSPLLGGFGFELHAGGMLTPRLALMGDMYIVEVIGDNQVTAQGIAGPAVQYWTHDRLWLRGTIGMAYKAHIQQIAIFGPDEDQESRGLGLAAAVGYERLRGRHFVLDLRARAGLALYNDQGAGTQMTASLGVNFY
jgi:hypothetical protein